MEGCIRIRLQICRRALVGAFSPRVRLPGAIPTQPTWRAKKSQPNPVPAGRFLGHFRPQVHVQPVPGTEPCSHLHLAALHSILCDPPLSRQWSLARPAAAECIHLTTTSCTDSPVESVVAPSSTIRPSTDKPKPTVLFQHVVAFVSITYM